MKKLFISVPMKNRTKEEILESMDKLQTIAEVVIGEKLERIDTYIEEKPQFLADGEPSYYKKLMYLGESIKRMAQADVYVGIEYPPNCFAGCCVENLAAELYGLKRVMIPPQYVIDNYDELCDKCYKEEYPVDYEEINRTDGLKTIL